MPNINNKNAIKIFFGKKGKRYLYERKISFLMAWHVRLGKNSLISKYANKDIARLICEKYLTFKNQFCGFDIPCDRLITKNIDGDKIVRLKNRIGLITRSLKVKSINLQSPLMILTKDPQVGQHRRNRYFTLNTKECVPKNNLSRFFKNIKTLEESLTYHPTQNITIRDSVMNMIVPYNDLEYKNIYVFDCNKKSLKIRTGVDAQSFFMNGTLVRAIVQIIPSKGPDKLNIQIKRIQIVGQMCPDIFEKNEFLDDDGYKYLKKFIDYKSRTRQLQESNCNSIEQLFVNSPIEIFIQTPVLPLTFDLSDKFVKDKYNVHVSFDNLEYSSVQKDFYDMLVMLDNMLVTKYGRNGTFLKHKKPYDPYLKLGILDYRYKNSSAKQVIDQEGNGIISNISHKLKKGVCVRAILGIAQMIDNDVCIPLCFILKQLQYFPEANVDDYAFEDLSSE